MKCRSYSWDMFNDIKPLREQILLISNNDITVSMIDTGGTDKPPLTTTTSVTTREQLPPLKVAK